MNAPLRLPDGYPQVTATWMEQALSQAFPCISLRAITQTEVIHGSASKIRFELDHKPGSNGPSSLWLKIGFEPASTLLNSAGIYSTEAVCYADILGQMGIHAPRSYFQMTQADPPQVAILLEDLRTHGVRFGRSTELRAVDEVRSGLKALARIHAQTWSKGEALQALGLKPAMTWGELLFLQAFAEQPASLFRSPRGYAVPLALHDADRLLRGWHRYKEIVLEGPTSLLHGDSHVGNTFIKPNGQVGFLDWQCATIGNWSHDIGYYMASALDVPQRRLHERALIGDYLEALACYGIAAPGFDEAWLGYRRSLFFPFLLWMGNPDEMQPPEVNTCCFARAGTAMIDLDVYEALEV